MHSPYLDELIRYAECFVGWVPYVYGGNNPRTGMDCSGFANYILRSVGLVGVKEDLSAQGLYDKFSKAPHSECPLYSVRTGDILFFGVDTSSIIHVSIAVNPFSAIECGGGGSTTKTVELANLVGAGVRRVSMRHRQDLIVAARPAYPWDDSNY